jgi:RNase P/RNase MRP subunit POP5
MVVKDKIGRRRYIAFEIVSDKSIPRTDVVKMVRKTFKQKYISVKPWLTRYKNNKGLLRCVHTGKGEAIRILNSVKQIGNITVEIKTVGTSGTIKAAMKKYF